MTEQQYEKISKPFRVSERRKQALILSNRMAALLVYAAYPAALVAAYQYSFRHLLISILVPGAAFILLSAFRSWYHAPRPYEKLSIDPIIKKDTKGKSFPSRHVFSAFMIDMVIFLRDPLNQKTHEPDLFNVMRLCDMHNIPLATNLATAELLVLALDRGDLEWREMYR